jgi:UDP-N-acetylmuramate--alanine ligase
MFFDGIPIRHRHIHFVGVGGIGMSGIAEILLNLGYTISGSDLRSSAITARLASMGARIFKGHDARNIQGADAIVVSSAIRESNPEHTAARLSQMPVIQRGELLAELMRLKYGIAIAGSHGKTTTTSMTAAVLHGADKDPTVVVGGRVDSLGSNARLGKGDILLVESDESDGSFLKLAPIQAVITSIDQEHLEHYQSFEGLVDAFVEFANKVPFYGSVILNLDDPEVRRIVPRVQTRVRTYGANAQADLVVGDLESRGFATVFRLAYRGDDLGVFEVNSLGSHNVANAMAAVLIGLELEIPPERIREGLRSFSGVDRRFQVRGKQAGVTVIDDYGHHPTEIAATLSAARNCGFNRVHVVFQPHRYSRSASLMDAFARCFDDCDRLYVLDVYSAGEEPIAGVNGEEIARRIRSAGKPEVEYVASMEAGVEQAVAGARSGDAILTLGAGSIWQAGEKLLARLAPEPERLTTAG